MTVEMPRQEGVRWGTGEEAGGRARRSNDHLLPLESRRPRIAEI